MATVLVTGSSKGIGFATALAFARAGHKVAAGMRNPARAPELAKIANHEKLPITVYAMDVDTDASVRDAVVRITAELGPIDVLVNNAGWDIFKPFTKTEPAQWDKLIAINLIGMLHMHHAVLPGMVARKAGRIVNIASDAGRVGSSGEAVYAACKGGLIAFSKTIAREHARHGRTSAGLYLAHAEALRRGEGARDHDRRRTARDDLPEPVHCRDPAFCDPAAIGL